MAILKLSPGPEREIYAVGLDVDGVVRDTGYKAYEIMCKVLAERKGIIPSFDTFVHNYTHDVVSFYKECGVDMPIGELLAIYRRHSNGHHDTCEPFHDVEDMLIHARKKKIRVFAVSSHPHEQVKEWFKSHRLDVYIDHVSGGSRDKTVCLVRACLLLGISPKRACYVGDWGADMRSAKDIDMISIGITRGYDSRDALLRSGATYVVDHLEELTSAIQ